MMPEQKRKNVVLSIPDGMKDYGPGESYRRRNICKTLTQLFQMHGAVEIETPVFELKEVVTEKYGENSNLIYNFEDQGGEMISMKYDQTVSFARYVAMNKIGSMKRYQIARVYRKDQPDINKGVYKEFCQCDFDIAGQYDSVAPDAECISVVHQALTRLNVGNFAIKLNHRKILSGVLGACGVLADKFRSIFWSLDKLNKLPWEAVRKEMVKENGLDECVVDQVEKYVKKSGKADLIEELLNDPKLKNSKDAQEGLQDIKSLFEYIKCLDCDSKVVFDMGLARGLDYYTGMILEAVSTENCAGNVVGSLVGGGRYDNLVGMFSKKNKSVPCVGVSFGVERLFALQERKKAEEGQIRFAPFKVLVASPCKGMLRERLKLVALLRKNSISAEITPEDNPKNLEYAEENCIPLVALIGGSELPEEQVKLLVVKLRKERTETKETTVSMSDLATTIQEKLSKILDS